MKVFSIPFIVFLLGSTGTLSSKILFRGRLGFLGSVGHQHLKVDMKSIQNNVPENQQIKTYEDGSPHLSAGVGLRAATGFESSPFILDAVGTLAYHPFQNMDSMVSGAEYIINSHWSFEAGILCGYRINNWVPFIKISGCMRPTNGQYTSKTLNYAEDQQNPEGVNFLKRQFFFGFIPAVGVLWEFAPAIEIGFEAGYAFYQKRSWKDTQEYTTQTLTKQTYFLESTEQPVSLNVSCHISWRFT